MATKQNIEYMTLLSCTSELTSEISADPASISTKLLAKGLIPPPPLYSSPKASELVQQVINGVKTFPNRYETFMSILSEFNWLQDVMQMIHEKYDGLKEDEEKVQCTHIIQSGKLSSYYYSPQRLKDGASEEQVSQCSIDLSPKCDEIKGKLLACVGRVAIILH